jgi:putative hemolysin
MRDLPSPTKPFFSLGLPKWMQAWQQRRPARRPLGTDGAGHKADAVAAAVQALPGPAQQHYTAAWATSLDEVRETQALRWKVFAEELGARLNSPVRGLDIDPFDAFCDHLLVRDHRGEVVGTYRALRPAQAEACGMWYSSLEFYLKPLFAHAHRSLEVGRSCVHRDHRNGTVMLLLWQELARHMDRHRLDLLFGCASVPMDDGGHGAASLWREFLEKGLVDEAVFCRPRKPLPLEALDASQKAEQPPLLKGYLRLGARIASAPAWDRDFNCADFLIVLRKENISPRYARHFFGAPLAAHA